MRNRIFRACVNSTTKSIYFADIVHNGHTIYCDTEDSLMWGSLRLVPIKEVQT